MHYLINKTGLKSLDFKIILKGKRLPKSKYVISIIYFCFTILCIQQFNSCSSPTNKSNSFISFPIKEYNFGVLPLKKSAAYRFNFTNPGEKPLIIYNVKTSCGCTIAEWTKKPVKENKSGFIKVIYDAEYPGNFVKEIKVYYNGSDSPALLRIKGIVQDN